jgi:hypothetical protein
MRQDVQNLLSDDDVREKIALRAYKIYEDRGGQHGRDIDDWLQAETDELSEAEQQQKRFHGGKQPSKAQSAEAPQSASRRQKPAGNAG